MLFRPTELFMKWNLFFASALFLIGACQKNEPEAFDWSMYSADPSGSKYAPLSQITPANVNNLEVAWIYKSGDIITHRSEIQCNPIIIKGVMYLITPGLKAVSVKADTGKEIWKFDPNNGQHSAGTNRGLSYYDDGKNGRIFYAVNSHLHCVDALSGVLIKTFGIDGKVPLNEGLGREADGLVVTATTPGVIYNDLYIIGSRVGEGPNPAAPGTIRAFDEKLEKQGGHFIRFPIRAKKDMRHGLLTPGKPLVVPIVGVASH